MAEVIRSNCRICTAGCGILIEVDAENVVGVKGDTSHPLSRGYVCPKGHSLRSTHHREDRLDWPMVRGAVADWHDVISDLSDRFTRLIGEFGPDSVGTYWGNGAATDTLGRLTLSRFTAALGSRQIYSSKTIDVAPAFVVSEIVAGNTRMTPTWLPDDEQSRLVIWLGQNPLVSHGYGTFFSDPVRRVKEFIRRGGSAWVIDPKATKTAGLAGHLQIRPGTDVALLAWLIRERLDEPLAADFVHDAGPVGIARLRQGVAPYDIDTVTRLTGIEESQLRKIADDIRRSGRISIVIGTGVTFDRHALVTDWLRWVFLCMTDSLDTPGGMRFQPGWLDPLDLSPTLTSPPSDEGSVPASRPELRTVFGELPVAALIDEISSGTLKALIVLGGNPVTAFPDPEATARALGNLDVLAVTDVTPSATTRISTHVLPATGQLERADLLERRRITLVPAVVPARHGRRPLWWVLGHVARQMGIDILGGLDPDRTTEDDLLMGLLRTGRGDAAYVAAQGSHGLDIPVPTRYVRKRLPGGRWNILPDPLLSRLEGLSPADLVPPTDRPFVFISGRQAGRNNSADFIPADKRRDSPALRINPDDAVRLDISDGSQVRVMNENGSFVTFAKLDSSILQGVVSAPHGWLEANVTSITSRTRDIDPMSGQPVMTSIPVSIEPVSDRHAELGHTADGQVHERQHRADAADGRPDAQPRTSHNW
jgi:anaerobic selenocysteine-containing dehydrogenase